MPSAHRRPAACRPLDPRFPSASGLQRGLLHELPAAPRLDAALCGPSRRRRGDGRSGHRSVHSDRHGGATAYRVGAGCVRSTQPLAPGDTLVPGLGPRAAVGGDAGRAHRAADGERPRLRCGHDRGRHHRRRSGAQEPVGRRDGLRRRDHGHPPGRRASPGSLAGREGGLRRPLLARRPLHGGLAGAGRDAARVPPSRGRSRPSVRV